MKQRCLALIGVILVIPCFAQPPLGLLKLVIPTDNLQSSAKITLGKQLFQDSRLSADGSISCASCHQSHLAFTDNKQYAVGINSQVGSRNSPSLINVAYYHKFFLDGRRNSLEQQVLDPFTNPIEHGLKNQQQIINIIRQDANYLTQFKHVFSIPSKAINKNHVAQSLASYLRTLTAGNSAFDRYLFGRNRSELSASAIRGLKIFRRKGNCANCHEISWDHALFSDNRFYNIGIGMEKLEPVLDKIVATYRLDKTNNFSALNKQQLSALGRFSVTGNIVDMGKFKTPILRNVAQTPPYMHDGSLKTLEQVVDYYDEGGNKNYFLDPAIYPLHLTAQEKLDLVAFMQALDSATLKINEWALH